MGNPPTQVSFLGEMNDVFCEQHCFAYHKCGGGYLTAPCQCAWKKTSKKYLNCKACYLICLRRSVTVRGRRVDSAREQFKAGLDLNDLAITQNLQEQFPLLIPLRTDDFPHKDSILPLRWAGVDATHLKQRILTGPISAPKFSDAQALRAFLHVPSTCRLMAVMNAQDKILERFWALNDRIGRFQQLRDYGFELSTGATFSVVERTTEDTFVPRFHNLVMQRRHHRVLSDIQGADLNAVPNFYWLDEREADRWVEWLVRNPTVRYVSREFTRTRRGDDVEAILEALLFLLGRTNRTYHIFLIGPGPAVAAYVLQRLAVEGHTGTILTSDPIIKGMKGRLYDSNFKGILDESRDRDEITIQNINMLESYLLDAVAGTSVNQNASRNMIVS
jgi:hypothetical protein